MLKHSSSVDASAPPLPDAYHDQFIPGYEHMADSESACLVPPPTPLDYTLNYFIHFPDEPPPPYEKEDSQSRQNNDDCVKHRPGSFHDNADVGSRMDENWCIPTDNHAYNPQWLQGMEISPIPEYEPFRNLSEDDAIEALSKFVSSNCCYNNGAAKQMKTTDIRPTHGHQYILETYFEERMTAWHQEPYTCQLVDGAEHGPPPAVWDITVPRPKMFQLSEVHVEVPHTASIKDCSLCSGKGVTECPPCSGTGDIKCSVCDGLGVVQHFAQEDLSVLERRASSVGCRSCHSCNGGKKLCQQCSGKGRKDCSTCTASGRVKVYIRLTAKWKRKRDQKVLGNTKLPNKCISEGGGTLVFQEQNDRVYPLLDFPEDEINIHSRKLINRHERDLKDGRIIMQRHCIREVPIAEIRSQWKRQEFTYWVYGNENQVYFPDYPAKCFSACTIL